jgi:hypothetical protein
MIDKKEELIMNMEKRLQTTMIGSIAKFEQNFAYLWEEPNINRERYEDIWEDTRNEILNHGNRQIRAALRELSDFLYNDHPKVESKYNYKFYFKDDNPNNGDRK